MWRFDRLGREPGRSTFAELEADLDHFIPAEYGLGIKE
jgi:hypothetical protein